MSEASYEEATRLDGNVAAGLLTEVFCHEPSVAWAICAGCGASAQIGRLLVYGLEMGAILRCPACDTAILRVGVTGSVVSVDMRGAAVLRFSVSG